MESQPPGKQPGSNDFVGLVKPSLENLETFGPLNPLITPNLFSSAINLKPDNDNNKTQLGKTYAFWCTIGAQDSNQNGTQEDYESRMNKIASFSTVEDFWAIYQHLVHPQNLPIKSDYFLFVDGIKPMWEDDNNKNGGKFTIKLKKDCCSIFWEKLSLAFISNKLDYKNNICGIAVSTKNALDTLSIWNKNASDEEVRNILKNNIIEVMGLSKNAEIEYREHYYNTNFGQKAYTTSKPSYVPKNSSKIQRNYIKKGEDKSDN